MSICLSRLRDTRIEKDSDNSTSSKDLLVRSVFEELPRREDMKHEVRLRALLAWLVQECFREYRKDDNTANELFENIPHEEAFIGNMIF